MNKKINNIIKEEILKFSTINNIINKIKNLSDLTEKEIKLLIIKNKKEILLNKKNYIDRLSIKLYKTKEELKELRKYKQLQNYYLEL